MKTSYRPVLGLLPLLLAAAAHASASPAPLALHPANPHYFLFRGKPTVIITSGEHYGAVLNLDFDFRKYLDTLAADGLNGTRTFSGAYCEPPSAFNIANNTLAPKAGRFLCPWGRSDQPGYANGGNKFDLTRRDPAYFQRLKEFLAHASERGVIVELNLFCPFYDDGMWKLSPMNAANNVNHVGDVPRTNVYTLDRHGGLLPVQEEMVRQIVRELKDFDNLYYEVCNEPYFGGVTMDWQHRIAEVIVETEKALGVRHLISLNVANDKAKVERPHPAISIFNFHYATPPDTVAMNYGLNKVIGDNETGFKGTNNTPYRIEAWDFIAAGGGLFNHLDYSFAAGHEDGTFRYPASQPGGGNPEYRRQLRFLKDTVHRLDFIAMRPDDGAVRSVLPKGVTARALSNPGREYLVYVSAGHGLKPEDPNRKTRFAADELELSLQLPAGRYRAEWLDPSAGKTARSETVAPAGGATAVKLPAFTDDIALVLRQQAK